MNEMKDHIELSKIHPVIATQVQIRELVETNGEIIELEPNTFNESSTNVNTVLVVLNK